MSARVVGASSARRRIVGAVLGRQGGGAEEVLGGHGRADDVVVGHRREVAGGVNRSPHSSVPVASS